jgi:hypothetical protein
MPMTLLRGMTGASRRTSSNAIGSSPSGHDPDIEGVAFEGVDHLRAALAVDDPVCRVLTCGVSRDPHRATLERLPSAHGD